MEGMDIDLLTIKQEEGDVSNLLSSDMVHQHNDSILQQHLQNQADEIFNYNENKRDSVIFEYIKKIRDQEKFCDVTLYVQGREFLCHKIVLACTSPFFDSIFLPKSSPGMVKLVVSSCQDPDIFQCFLNYIYTGFISISKSNVLEIMRLANHFHIVKLKEYCSEYFTKHIDYENCLNIKEMGDKFQMPDLTKCASTFIRDNLENILNSEMMMELAAKQLQSFITEKSWLIPQETSLKVISRWVNTDLTREQYFCQLLSEINFCFIDTNVLIDYIDQEPLYGVSERCFYHILNSISEKGIHIQKYEPMHIALKQRFAQEDNQSLDLGDNLLQMAFNSAMEGLQVPNSLLMMEGRETTKPKWQNENKSLGKLEQRRKRILRQIQKNRALKKVLIVRLDRPKRRKLAYNEVIAESSGEEDECDPIQVEGGGYRCHMCPYVSKKVSRLERHLAVVHARDIVYRCSENGCQYICKWNRDYFLHMKSHFDGPPYRCSKQNCQYHCQKIGSLIAHKLSHVDLKPFVCSECNFKCRTKANLASHSKIHNTDKCYKCTFCGRTFAQKSALDQHAVSHNTEKTYSCAHCSFSTKYLNQFTNHKKVHNQAPSTNKKGETYKCQDSQCKYTTTKKSQLDSHMRSRHAGVTAMRPHCCGICGRRFLEKSHLVRHERIHYNERPFKCEECDYASTRRDKLKEHKSRHHGLNASAKSPYKPRPHKSKQQNSGADGIVYAKKSSVSQQQQQVLQVEQDISQVTTTTGQEMEFMPNLHITTDSNNTGYAELAQGTSIDLQQMAASGIVQLRSFQGKSEIHVSHGLPTTLSTADIQRFGVKLEDLQAQGLLGLQGTGTTKAIKLEDLGVQVAGQAINTQGRTMILDASQLQQLAAITLPSNPNQQQRNNNNENMNDANQNANDFSNLLY